MTFGEYVVSISSLSTGTFLEHMLNIEAGEGGTINYTVQAIMYGELQKTIPIAGVTQKITNFEGQLQNISQLNGEINVINPIQGIVTKTNLLKGEIKCQQ